ncbi:hypothetical protein KAR91_64530 [Candidatus Pacearchaeota archaeon]|nr:hypothetical protein [Candidatus Pacearchaeota archaeon]
MIKPWHAKSFLQLMTWSSVRDYPPKTKKPWLFNNFMEMEEIHSDHMTMPSLEPGALPLPPDPDIPQTPEDVEPDPCAGDRSLWVIANPSSVDCSISTAFSLLFSPDFRCINLQQAFFDADGPKLVDQLGNDLSNPVNTDDIIGDLQLEKGCDGADSIILWASDCLCGGVASVDIWLENCGTDCEAVFVAGLTQISSYSVTQYSLANFSAGEVAWSIAGEGATIDQNGVLTADGACGTINVIATTECCGAVNQPVQITDDGLWVQASIEYAGPLCPTGVDYGDEECETVIQGVPGESAFTKIVYNCKVAELGYELPGDCLYCPCPPHPSYNSIWSSSITIYNWECTP